MSVLQRMPSFNVTNVHCRPVVVDTIDYKVNSVDQDETANNKTLWRDVSSSEVDAPVQNSIMAFFWVVESFAKEAYWLLDYFSFR
jgi:hypothetical protein